VRILIIGGTHFLGRHLVEAALARNHEVTLFNRGKTNPGHFWEAVVDTSGYVPRLVRLSAEVLKDNVPQYVFISTVSVYEDFKKVGITESDPVAKIQNETTEEITGETYGPLKALCEQAVHDVFGREGTLIVRPGLIVGPHDPTDRFTYWLVRVRRGGDVLAPQKPEAPIQIIDARDLAEFIIQLIEEHAFGIYNATSPADELTMGKLLEVSKQVSGSDANFKWASVEFLEQNNVQPWSDMPVWIPDDEEHAGFARVDAVKAIQAGLTFRPLEETVRDTLEWAKMRPADHEWRAGLKPEREQELLALLNK
jgi:2'-hydroxyisoflavone reductase